MSFGNMFSEWMGSGEEYALTQRKIDNERAVANENLRRMRLQHDQTLGTARAAGANSGLSFQSEGLQKYLQDMHAEFARQETFYDNQMAQKRRMEGEASAWKLGAGLFNAFGEGMAGQGGM